MGVESDMVKQYRQKSKLTDVNILEEDECPDSIFDYIQNDLLESVLNLDSPQPL